MKKLYSTLVFTGAFLWGSLAFAQGVIDQNFGTNGYQFLDYGSKDQNGKAIAVQQNGKVVFGGTHEHSANKTDWLIYRVNANGSLDQSFSNDGRVTESFSDKDELMSLAIRPNGKIVAVGYIETQSNGKDIMIMQFDSDGSIDNNFGTNGTVQLDPSIGGDDYAVDVEIAPNGKIYVAGFMQLSNEAYFMAYRLKSNGSLDNSFSLNGFHYHDMDAFGAVYDGSLAPDGSYFVGGTVVENSDFKMAIVKFKTNGQLDDSFDTDGIKVFQPGLNTQAYLEGIAALPNGGVSGVGTTDDNGGTNSVFVSLTNSGAVDVITSNDFTVKDGFSKIKYLANGNYLVVGRRETGGKDRAHLYQLDANGDVDYSGYGNNGKLGITISNDDEVVEQIAINNTHAFTVGTYKNGSHTDIYVSKSSLLNPVDVKEYTLSAGQVKLAPNPIRSSQAFNVLLGDELNGEVSVSVTSITGAVLYHDNFEKTSSTMEKSVSVAGLARGIYMVQVMNNEKVGTQKLIVQ